MHKPLLLVVEDDPINCDILVDTLQENGYEVIIAVTGAEAWQKITEERERLHAILLDRILPDMDSLNLLVPLKADPVLTHVPVIMQTSMSSEADVADGLRAGAYYYLTKPFAPDTLLAIVRSAVQDRQEYIELQQSLRQARNLFGHMERAEFWFRTREEARDLATLTAHVAPDPGRVILGLTELMLNAVEHGNLSISYAEKTLLIATDSLQVEVAHRLKNTEYGKRRAHLKIDRDARAVHFTVRDEGTGFEWQPFLDMSPSRAFDTHGRGIAMSRMLSFDQLEYRGAGNEVTGSINL